MCIMSTTGCSPAAVAERKKSSWSGVMYRVELSMPMNWQPRLRLVVLFYTHPLTHR